ncbi:MAG: 16S rRNA (cytosine(1402)-N(4))-methyltransferase RsmH [Bacteroidales bacterium]|nr:16S rRNA (cytosine(1402)-N(4))-methyltransferase RsmH [Bacteroidales bacterium]
MDYHQSVLLEESIEGLNIKPNGIYVDATFGGGGHSREILKKLKNGRLVAFDQDEDALQNIPNDNRIIFVRQNFRFLKNFLKYYSVDHIDGLIADLGVSSHHFDTPQRGFSFRFDTNLDMRMNMKSEFSARNFLNDYSKAEMTRVFREYGELKNAATLASKIYEYRNKNSLVTNHDLFEAIASCLPRHNENQYLAKVFQAMRIEVNKEIEHLKKLLIHTVDVLKHKGRVVIISYHSLEDRLVKNFFRNGNFSAKNKTDLYGNVIRPLIPVNRKVIVPDEAEIKQNSRSRSARLRIAEKP